MLRLRGVCMCVCRKCVCSQVNVTMFEMECRGWDYNICVGFAIACVFCQFRSHNHTVHHDSIGCQVLGANVQELDSALYCSTLLSISYNRRNTSGPHIVTMCDWLRNSFCGETGLCNGIFGEGGCLEWRGGDCWYNGGKYVGMW